MQGIHDSDDFYRDTSHNTLKTNNDMFLQIYIHTTRTLLVVLLGGPIKTLKLHAYLVFDEAEYWENRCLTCRSC